ncbi:hypothetical protein SO802_023663 [Lithocarpus litseifolius]|uniref:Alcohol dehydrogenase-like N-terminal domain-containing protein n=1 Tax=Lithocarpus litseifolius TaxID=425828 RepID=A0AAW2CC80_9ROSI
MWDSQAPLAPRSVLDLPDDPCIININTLKIQPFKLPPLGPHDVKIRVKAVGICGSDVHFLKTLRCADFIVKEPMVIGHECAGLIEEVGSEVKKLVPGDHVALEPGISCWQCNLCKEGRYNLCLEMKFFATPPVHGSLANQLQALSEIHLSTYRWFILQTYALNCQTMSAGRKGLCVNP